MISIYPNEYNSDYDGVILNTLKISESPKVFEARRQIQATLDGDAFVEVSAVTYAGSELKFEILNVSKTDEQKIRNIMENMIEVMVTASVLEYTIYGYITKLEYGDGTVKLTVAVSSIGR